MDDCFEHVRSLLKTAKHLHHNNDYPNSIFFTIIAFEEFGKLYTYSEYYKKQIGVPRKEIKKLNQHQYKLKKLINYYESTITGVSEEVYNKAEETAQLNLGLEQKSLNHLRKSSAKTKEFFSALDYVKQFILYYDFREGRSLTLSHQITKNNIGHLSLFLLEYVMFFINYEYVRFQYDPIFFTIPNESNIVSENPSWKECIKFAELIRSESYQPTIDKAILSVREIKAVYEELERRNLLIK